MLKMQYTLHKNMLYFLQRFSFLICKISVFTCCKFNNKLHFRCLFSFHTPSLLNFPLKPKRDHSKVIVSIRYSGLPKKKDR